MTDRHIIALGGGRAFAQGDSDPFRAYMFELTGKERPDVLLIHTATGDTDIIAATQMRQLSLLGCRGDYLPLFERTPRDLTAYVMDYDLVWVGGGNTKSMLAVWREWELDKSLRTAYENGVVMAGTSAGAICCFEHCCTDAWEDRMDLIPCLGWLKGAMSPHYNSEADRRPTYQHMFQAGQLNYGYAADDCAFLHFKNETFAGAFTYKPDAKVYTLDTTREQLEMAQETVLLKTQG